MLALPKEVQNVLVLPTVGNAKNYLVYIVGWNCNKGKAKTHLGQNIYSATSYIGSVFIKLVLCYGLWWLLMFDMPGHYLSREWMACTRIHPVYLAPNTSWMLRLLLTQPIMRTTGAMRTICPLEYTTFRTARCGHQHISPFFMQLDTKGCFEKSPWVIFIVA